LKIVVLPDFASLRLGRIILNTRTEPATKTIKLPVIKPVRIPGDRFAANEDF
jgi:hypothetical protein